MTIMVTHIKNKNQAKHNTKHGNKIKIQKKKKKEEGKKKHPK